MSEKIEQLRYLSLKDTRTFIETLIPTKIVPFIWGSPAQGKSDVIRQVAEDLSFEVIDLRLAQMDPTDLSGLPFPDEKGETYAFLPNTLFPLTDTPIPEGKKGWVLLLDEINHAVPAIQAAAYKLILDRMVGMHHLHDACYVIAAGNLDTDRAITYKISSALQSRMAHVYMKTTFDEFFDYALQNNFHPSILGMLKMYPTSYYQMTREFTYPAPRTWAFMSAFLYKVQESERKLSSLLVEELQAFIGPSTGIKFKAFLDVLGVTVSIDQIYEDPNNAPIADSNMENYAIAAEILSIYKQDKEKKETNKLRALALYLKRMKPELQIMVLRGLDMDMFAYETMAKLAEEMGNKL